MMPKIFMLGVFVVMILLAASFVVCQAPSLVPIIPSPQVNVAESPTQQFEPTRRRPATITPEPGSTFTRQQSSTSTLTPTRLPELVVYHDAYCFTEPGVVCGMVNTLIKEAVARVIGRGEGGYWVISVPFRPDVRCWISSKFAVY